MIPFLAQAAGESAVSARPFFVLAACVAFIIIAITKLRLHAFIALISAGLLAGWLSSNSLVEMTASIGQVAVGFGNTAKGVALVIALASIIGMCLMDSGAADMIVRRFMKIFGEKRAGLALLASGFFLSIPVFFDTMFFLVIPIARMLALRTGKNYLYYVMAIAGGGAITHSIVPPTPGPLLVGGELGLDLGVLIIAGVLAGVPPALIGLRFVKWLDSRMSIPIRESAGGSIEDLKSSLNKKDSELPSFAKSVLPVILPVVLLAAYSTIDMLENKDIRAGIETRFVEEAGSAEGVDMKAMNLEIKEATKNPANHSGLHHVAAFFGDKVIALGLGAIVALWILVGQTKINMDGISEKFTGPLETAGVIILITSAGGAFGHMIRETGIGEAIGALGQGASMDHSYILLAWFVTAVIRIAQGSATVSMITGVGLMSTIVLGGDVTLSYHPLYIFLAIGFGSITCSWMNDSGFWIVGRLSGFTQEETFKTWTPLLTLIAVVGLIETFVFSFLIPLN